MEMKQLRIGTCSFKYPSWKGLIYSEDAHIDYLREYSNHFDSVEIDRWFWSLFYPHGPVLPDPMVVQEYFDSTPDDFTFSIKAPNSLSLTHYYRKDTGGALEPNPHFYSLELYERFLELIAPLENKIDSIIFQFEYLNKQKMNGLAEFIDLTGEFFSKIPKPIPLALEIRNKNFLTPVYFDFLREQQICHTFVHGYWMPTMQDVYTRHGDRLGPKTVIRLMGEDRKGIEKLTGKKWNKIILDKDGELRSIAGTIRSMLERNTFVTVNVNNHYQGSAPLTIEKLRTFLDG